MLLMATKLNEPVGLTRIRTKINTERKNNNEEMSEEIWSEIFFFATLDSPAAT